MKIIDIHREVAKLIWDGDLTLLQIAGQKRITERTISNWKLKPEFDQLLKNLEDEHRSLAKREAIRWARRSVKTLVKLQDIAITKDASGQVVSEEFKFGADVARKAACDLLEMAEVKVQKVEGEGFAGSSLIIVQSGNGDRSAEGNKAETVSDRFRFQQN